MGTSLLTDLGKIGLANGPLAHTSTLQQLKSTAKLPLKAVTAKILRLLAYYSPIAVLSIAFILRNGRIVLGDQDNHQVSLHWVQPLYCVTLMTSFGWPALLSSQWTTFISPSRWLRSISSLALLSVICLAAIHHGTIEHPFLLADNRHYTFYIWRRVINRTEWSRYALAPFYAFILKVWWNALGEIFPLRLIKRDADHLLLVSKHKRQVSSGLQASLCVHVRQSFLHR
jgi:alpha-1,2-glucosyltransferase